MSVNMSMLRRTLFNIFDPIKPVEINDSYYVDLNTIRGTAKLLQMMEDNIVLAAKPTYQLISGHRGSGKTTELVRLRKTLSEQNYFVVYCDAESYLELTDVEYPDVLLTILQAVWSEAKNAGFTLQSDTAAGKFRSFIKNIWHVASNSTLTEVEIDATIAKLKFDIPKNPDIRQATRSKLRSEIVSFLDAINEIIDEVKKFIQKDFFDLVVIFDNLEKMIPVPIANTNRTNQEVIFIDNANNLTSIKSHVIYTVAPTLVSSVESNKLPRLYDAITMIPIIPVTTRKDLPYSAGGNIMQQVIVARLKEAKSSINDVFDSTETVELLCKHSGGYVRDLMTMTRTAITYNRSLPITEDVVKSVIRDRRNQVTRTIRNGKDWEILRKVASTKKFPNDAELLDSALELLEALIIFLYYDEQEGYWYDVHPVVRETLPIS